MRCIIIFVAFSTLVRGGHISFPSSYSSASGEQYHPQGWSDLSQGSSDSVFGPVHKQVYPEHIPIIKNGVPVETPEVQAAKTHFYMEYLRSAALAALKPDPLDGQYAEEFHGGKYLPKNKGWTGGSNGPTHIQTGPIWEKNNGYNHNNFVPADTPEVHEAKLAHFQAYAAALSRAHSQKHHHRYRRSATEWAQPKYQGPIHVPQITPEGVPADTVEVQKARLIHHEALSQAAARAHAAGSDEEDNSWNESDEPEAWSGSADQGTQAYGPPKSAGWPSTPTNIAYKVHHDHIQKWHGPQHMPVLDHNGVPIDTPEVQHARKEHLAALAAESLKHKGWEGVQKKW
ncbi:hypothetical protein HHI36_014708 [Cryptolaemus montrouzieri]|uniref:Uncharacterized protein n=1 Tax=Cryptolaemus montrouzieri TaxID=559131 RepID=A0ABD2N3M3_9CUCU